MLYLDSHVLAEVSGAVFYDSNSQLVYLSLQVEQTFLYTLLIVGRLFYCHDDGR